MDFNYELLIPPLALDMVKQWLHEDMSSFDFNNFIIGNSKISTFHLYCKNDCILSGLAFVKLLIEEYSLSAEYFYHDGDKINLNKEKFDSNGNL